MRYAGAVGESVNEIRLIPSDNGRQRVEWSHVRVEPAAELVGHTDAFGNEVRWFQLVGAHDGLVVESEAIVHTSAAPRPPAGAGGDLSGLGDPAYVDRHAEILSPSAHGRWGGPVADLAKGLELDEGEGALPWVRGLEAEVNRAIAYTTGVTRVDTPVEEVVRAGAGSLPGHGPPHDRALPAARDGGALRERLAPPSRHRAARREPRLDRGGRAGPGVGRARPTHPDPGHEDYVRLALGRDYADVPPLRGSYLGPPTESMSVVVQVVELPV